MPRKIKIKCAATIGSLRNRFDTQDEAIEWLLGKAKYLPVKQIVIRLIDILLKRFNNDLDKVRDYFVEHFDKGIYVLADKRVCWVEPSLKITEESTKHNYVLRMEEFVAPRKHAKRPFEDFKFDYRVEFDVEDEVNNEEVFVLAEGALSMFKPSQLKKRPKRMDFFDL